MISTWKKINQGRTLSDWGLGLLWIIGSQRGPGWEIDTWEYKGQEERIWRISVPKQKILKALKKEGVCLFGKERKLMRANKAQEGEGEKGRSLSWKALVTVKVWGFLAGEWDIWFAIWRSFWLQCGEQPWRESRIETGDALGSYFNSEKIQCGLDWVTEM